MTHTRKLNESEGEFTETVHTLQKCRSCKGQNVTCRTWESSDGAYEDYRYDCADCGFFWWIDGIDS